MYSKVCGMTLQRTGAHSANFNKKAHKPQSYRTLAVTRVKKQIVQKNKNKILGI